MFGELPVVGLAEEITTPGEGQVRALITVAGNPLVSTPDAGALEAAVETLDFMVSVDIYVNETTRHADVILPAPEPLAKAHYDAALYQLAVRSVANWSAPVIDPPDGQPHEWEVILRLAAIAAGQGPDADIEAWDDLVIQTLIGREVALPGSPIEGREPAEIAEALGDRRGPERIIDFMLRTGPFGEGFGADPDGLTLAKLEASPHGIDMGPMRPRLPEVLRTPSGKIELAPRGDRRRRAAARGRARRSHVNGDMVLIGRRQLRSNNSWMHNLPALVKGKDTCTLQVHPDDAERLGLADDGARAGHLGLGRAGRAGRGDRRDHARRRLDPARLGPRRARRPHGRRRASTPASTRTCSPPVDVDVPSGNAVLNGIPVEVTAADREPALA